ncbi:hypothetical protein [Streptomyces sp. NPDC059743]|uniref:hypothetical protein n=1 Tax=Streptomyces sp. NPDC059743 TaxID=3346928 RepID=UPI00366708D3
MAAQGRCPCRPPVRQSDDHRSRGRRRRDTAPPLTLRIGTVNTTAAPVTLSWKVTDSAALKEVRLTAPLVKTYGPTVTSTAHTAKPGSQPLGR